MSKNLIEFIPEGVSYSISKVYDGVYNDYSLASMNFKIIKSTLESLNSELTNRFGTLNDLPGLQDTLRRIDYIILRIDDWFINNQIYKNQDAEVFLDSLSDRITELKGMLNEIDSDK